MWFRAWFDSLKTMTSKSRAERKRHRPRVERLEDRLVPSGSGFGSVTQDPADLSADWPSSGHDWFNTGYNAAERAISAETVADLEVSWQHGPTSVVGTPIISEGVVYLADSFGVVYAKDAATGASIWANDVSDALDPIFGASFQAAPVVTQDAVFVADSDAFVYRLDRRTGTLEWTTRVDDNPNALIQSDPIVFDGQVLVGVASHENEQPGADPTDNFTLRGSIVALDAKTGAIVWRTFTTSDQALEHPKFGAGAGVWSSPAIDPRTERLFIGTGNYYEPGSDNPSPPSRHDKDLSDSLVALSTKNGNVKDSRQFTANDVWGHAFPDGPDFDVGAPPNLFSIPTGHGHKMRDVVGVGDKEGTYYVMDRNTLEVIWTRKISHGGLIGGIQSTAAVGNGVVYVASHELFDGNSIDSVIPRDQAAVWLNSPEGGFILQNLCKANVYALDAVTGATLWSREIQGGATFAPLILTNGSGDGITDDVLFMADAGGRLRALDAANGGADLFNGPGFIQLTLPFPNPEDPGGPLIQVGQFITALSVAHGRLYVSHGIPVEGLNPGGVTVFALPVLAGSATTAGGDHQSRITISDVVKKQGQKVAGPGVLANDSDVDNNSLTVMLVGGPIHGTLTLNSNGSFTYTPAAGFSGIDSFTYQAGGGATTSAPVAVTIAVRPVTLVRPVHIDVYPGAINRASNGFITVSLLGTATFDAARVDAHTVLFAGAAAVQSTTADVDGDGDLDLVVTFHTPDTALGEIYGQLRASADQVVDGRPDPTVSTRQRALVGLTGRTLDGELFGGFDEVNLFLAGSALRDVLSRLAATSRI